jgi:hypothetical protein
LRCTPEDFFERIARTFFRWRSRLRGRVAFLGCWRIVFSWRSRRGWCPPKERIAQPAQRIVRALA